MDDIEVRRYRDDDYDTLSNWFHKWGLPIPCKHQLSTTGFIVPGMAAGFLYLTNSSIGIIDSYISDPDSDKLERDSALDAITVMLFRLAKDSQCSLVKCDSQHECIKRRAQRLGFDYIGEFSSFTRGL